MKSSLKRVVMIMASLGLPLTAQAKLGSFGSNEGYYPFYGTMYGEVTYYNAGQHGPAAGGGVYQQILPDTGLWSLQSPVGAVFSNPLDRAAYTASAPTYAPTDPNGVPVYMLGGHFPGRNGDGANLAFRNDTPVGTGPALYHYTLDTYDTGGPVPALVISGPVEIGFYFCPNPADPPNPTGGRAGDKFTLSAIDGSGNIGMQWGYARDNEVTWRDSPSSSWNYTGVYANAANWDGVKIYLDLTTSTFGADYYVVATNTWSTMIPSGTPMGMAMGNLTTLGWQLEDGVFSGTGGKNYFDDFSIQVPEPSSVALLALGGLAAIARRRRNV